MDTNIKMQKGGSLINLLLIVLLLVTTTGLVYFYVNYTMLLTSEPECLPTEKECPTPKDMVIKELPPVEETPNYFFIPSGLFEDTEKTELTQKVLDPFYYFNKDNGSLYQTIVVEKVDSAGYRYEINAYGEYGENQVYTGFLYGTTTPLEYWIPDCMGVCVFSDTFEENFPNTVDAYTNE